MTGDNYIMNPDGSFTVETDLLKWAEWMQGGGQRRVDETTIERVRVRTVFLGNDHNFGPHGGIPILFETMIFGEEHDQYQARYATRDLPEAARRDASREG